MKIGILTFHCAINYGAVLQTYGLCQYLRNMGHEVWVIDYRPHYLRNLYKIYSTHRFEAQRLQPCGIRELRELLSVPTRLSRKAKFHRFLAQHIPIAQLDLQDTTHGFDAFVFGSDQIWNPCHTYFDPVFFADAPAFRVSRRVSYAASAGSADYLKGGSQTKIKSLLSNFHAISVREESLAHYLADECGLDAQIHIDPVLLAGYSAFNGIVSPVQAKRPYVLLFTLDDYRHGLPIAEQIAGEEGLEIKIAVSSLITFKDRHVMQALSIEKLLGYIMNASHVVTSSYHGTVLSILFRREFTAFYDNERSGERIVELLSDLGLQDRLHVSGTTGKKEIDWNQVHERLEMCREKSYKYFQQALKE